MNLILALENKTCDTLRSHPFDFHAHYDGERIKLSIETKKIRNGKTAVVLPPRQKDMTTVNLKHLVGNWINNTQQIEIELNYRYLSARSGKASSYIRKDTLFLKKEDTSLLILPKEIEIGLRYRLFPETGTLQLAFTNRMKELIRIFGNEYDRRIEFVFQDSKKKKLFTSGFSFGLEKEKPFVGSLLKPNETQTCNIDLHNHINDKAWSETANIIVKTHFRFSVPNSDLSGKFQITDTLKVNHHQTVPYTVKRNLIEKGISRDH